MLGLKIKEYIVSSGLKLGVIADKAGIARNVFSSMMNGKRKITAEEYFSICNVLNVPLGSFNDAKAETIYSEERMEA